MTNASVLVRAARKSRGLTQKDLAQRTNVDQGRVSRFEGGREAEFSIVERFLSGTGHRLYSAPTRRDDAATIASAIRGCLRAGDKYSALRELILLSDNLRSEHGLVRRVLGLAEPEPTGDQAWDAAFAALVDLRLSEAGLAPTRHRQVGA
ncbi:multiprotein-bridging factor 1 family protein [Microbacterium sp. M]|uniref:helix-turn-helix domain-containing protein n=1 Tax=Microbacterium sp. M TaxID=3377125 RepID=UPI00386F55ED